MRNFTLEQTLIGKQRGGSNDVDDNPSTEDTKCPVVNNENDPHPSDGSKKEKKLPCRKSPLSPPRFRSLNSQGAALKKSLEKKPVEDNSFQKLKGQQQTKFEKYQDNQRNKGSAKKRKTNDAVMTNMSETVNKEGKTMMKDSTDDPALSEEDFSFQKLKERALNMERKNTEKVGSDVRSKNIDCDTPKPSKKISERLKVSSSSATRSMSTPNRCNRDSKEKNHEFEVRTSQGKELPRARSLADDNNDQTKIKENSEAHLDRPSRQCSITPSRIRTIPNINLVKNGGVINPSSSNSKPSQVDQASKSSAFTPTRYRFKPKIKKEEVQATDDANASVKKLSQWLADDPFNNQKPVVIRKGAGIISKSRVFENDQCEAVIKEKHNFQAGKVSEGKKWLKGAFGSNKDCEEEKDGVSQKKKQLESAFKNK